MAKVVVTGSAGFIGFHLCQKLLQEGFKVIGLDNFSDYYDVELKYSRNEFLQKNDNFESVFLDVEDRSALENIFRNEKITLVIHLAAQAGVRYSIEHPESYITTNLVGTFNILEVCRHFPPKHLMIASTSSAYGANTDMPFDELQKSDHQLSLYAATKKSTELISHSYAHLFNTPITMFRFFTVYGPWGRPDMALFKFAEAIADDKEIEIYNYGDMKRDFTYVQDLVDSIYKLTRVIPKSIDEVERYCGGNDSLSPVAPWRVVNIGQGKPEPLMDYIQCLEEALGKEAKKKYLPMQAGDVKETFASNKLLNDLIGYVPKTSISDGVKKFVDWYTAYDGRID